MMMPGLMTAGQGDKALATTLEGHPAFCYLRGAGASSPTRPHRKTSMKLDRIYTRSGDDGRTSLGDGARLPKFHTRVAAYGSIDEANSVIGIALL